MDRIFQCVTALPARVLLACYLLRWHNGPQWQLHQTCCSRPKTVMTKKNENSPLPHPPANGNDALPQPQASPVTKEVNGPKGLDPTRYGDWERNGRCIDF